MGISGTFSVKTPSMVRYICTICISDSKLSCGETPAFTNTLTTFSGMTIFPRFDTTCSNTLSVNNMSGSVSGYGRLFHIASLSLINLHRISPMCHSVIFSGLTSAAGTSIFVAMGLLDGFGFNILWPTDIPAVVCFFGSCSSEWKEHQSQHQWRWERLNISRS